MLRRIGDQVFLKVEAGGGSGQESSQNLTAATIEDVVAKEFLVSLLCKFGTLYRMAQELNADVLVLPPGSQI